MNALRILTNALKPTVFDTLQETIKCCNCCDTCKKVTQQPTIWGNPNATFLILISYPMASTTDVDYLYEVLFNDLKIDPNIVAVSYAVHCAPFTDNQLRPPYAKEAKTCSLYTQQLIDIVEPIAIICFGTIASNLFMRQTMNDALKEPNFIKNTPIFNTYALEHMLELRKNNPEKFDSKKNIFYGKIQEALKYVEKTYPALKIYQ